MSFHDSEKQAESSTRFSDVAAQSSDARGPNKTGAVRDDGKLTLTEDEALERARRAPEEARLMCLCYSADDEDNPRNWATAKRWYVTCLVCWFNVLTCFCAGGISSASEDMASTFGVSDEVTTLCLSMYILGFAIGPMFLAPLSEFFGRSPVYISTWFVLVVLHIGLALAPNVGAVIAVRFCAGFFGSAPLTNSGGTISDLWRRDESGIPMAIYGLSSTGGPPLALVVAGYLAQNLGWRWLFWVQMITVGFFWVVMALTLPETRHTTVLDRKTRRVRKQMRKEGLAAAEHVMDANAEEKTGLHSLFAIALTRPVRFLFTEPITFLAAAYNGFVYGLVYLFNEAFPLVFGPTGHGFSTGQWGLTFLGLLMGSLVGALLHPLQERVYLRRAAQNYERGVPEARMWMARGGAFLLPISLLWFGWTSYASVPWIVPVIASGFFGLGIYIVILSILNYVVDSYGPYSASALAGVILVRNTVGAGFPLFARQMYETLGLEWASSLLAFLAVPLIPIPFVFYYRGERIRLRSPWAREHFEQDEDEPH